MRAVIYHGPRDIKIEERPITSPGPGEVLVKIGAALTCGTDFKAYRQGHRVLLGDYPSPFGHEFAGTVAAIGKNVMTTPVYQGIPKEGDRVVVANSAPMDDCFWCKNGQNHLCPKLKLHNGAYAQYNLVPAHIVRRNLHPLRASTPFEVGAMAEPFSCAIHAAEVHAVREGETALVIGAGPMCLFLIHALRARGARVGVLGRSKAPLAATKIAGAEMTVSVLDGSADEIVRAWAEDRGPDHVFEAVGAPETYLSAVALVRDGGKVCLFGGCAPGTLVAFDVHRLHYKQITLHGVFHHTPPHFKEAVRLLSEGKVRTELLMKGTVALTDIPAFFAANADASIPKAVVTP